MTQERMTDDELVERMAKVMALQSWSELLPGSKARLLSDARAALAVGRVIRERDIAQASEHALKVLVAHNESVSEALRARVEVLEKALQSIANHPEAEIVLTDYGPDGRQRVWPTVAQEARAALSTESEINEGS